MPRTRLSGVAVAAATALTAVCATGAMAGAPAPPPSMPARVEVPSPPTFSQHAYVKQSNTQTIDIFGSAVAIDGDTLVVGAPGEDSNATGVNGLQTDNSEASSGAVYVFTRSGGIWSQQAYIKASNTDPSDLFGAAVAISGDTLVVGATGEDSDGSSQTDNTLEDAGAAYVFIRSGSTWTQQAYLKSASPDDEDFFGNSVAISGDTIVIGVRGDDSNAVGVGGDATDDSLIDSGAAFVYTRAGTVWSEQAYLKAAVTDAIDQFGFDVAVDADTIAVGARFEDSSATLVNSNATLDDSTDAGAAYAFTRSGTVWSQQAYIKASNTGGNDQFGSSVDVNGDTIVVGAPLEDSSASGVGGDESNNGATSAGAAYIYHRATGTWSKQAYAKAHSPMTGDGFGTSVAVNGDRVLAGAEGDDADVTGVNPFDSSSGATDAGAALLFERISGVWSPAAFIKASNSANSDTFGRAVDMDADELVAGSPFEDSNALGVNGDQANDLAGNAGAAYVYGAACSTAPFADVSTGHPFCAEIEWMKQTKISLGFNDGTYQPATGVTRQAMSAFLARLKSASLTVCTSEPFTDVPTTHPFCKEIKWMQEEGISNGFNDGTYKPEIDVTRQAMSAFMSRAAGELSPPGCSSPPFTDVPTTHPFCHFIKWMSVNGISTGFNDGTYKPDISVTRQAMAAFMYRLANVLNS